MYWRKGIAGWTLIMMRYRGSKGGIAMSRKKWEAGLVLMVAIMMVTACTPPIQEAAVGQKATVKQSEMKNSEDKKSMELWRQIWLMLGEEMRIDLTTQGFVDPEIFYRSDDPTIVSVDEDGTIKANALGETEIYVLVHSAGEKDYMIKSIDVEVKLLLRAIEPAPKYVNITEGQEAVIEINTSPREAKKYVDFTFVVSDEGCFSFDSQTGTIKGLKEGRGILKIIYTDENSEVVGQCVVNVLGH